MRVADEVETSGLWGTMCGTSAVVGAGNLAARPNSAMLIATSPHALSFSLQVANQGAHHLFAFKDDMPNEICRASSVTGRSPQACIDAGEVPAVSALDG